MSYDKYLAERKEDICAELKVIEEKLEKAPEGRLTICKCKSRAYYFITVEDKESNKIKKYLPKSNIKLIKALAVKRFNLYRKKELINELNAIDAYFAVRNKLSKSVKKNAEENVELKKLVFANEKTYDDYVEKWLNEPFEPNPKNRNYLVVPTNTDEKVRSKSEAMIYNKLLESGLPFVYEKPININGEIRYPDFTILDPNTRKIYFYEHFGMLDKPDYINDFTYKMNLYTRNGILLNHNFIMTYETNNIPFDIKQVDEIIDRIKNNGYVDIHENR